MGAGAGFSAAGASDAAFAEAFFAGAFFAAFLATAFFAGVFFTAALRAGFAAFSGAFAVGVSKRSSVVFLLILRVVEKGMRHSFRMDDGVGNDGVDGILGLHR